MKEIAKQIINYWYSLDALQPKIVSDYTKIEKNKPKVFEIFSDHIKLYQQSAIDFSLIDSDSYYKTVSELVLPIPDIVHSQSLLSYLTHFEEYYKKWISTYTVDLSCAVFTCVVDGTSVLEQFINKMGITDIPETPLFPALYCSSFMTDNDGNYVADSVRLSPFIWAVRELVLFPDKPLQNLHLHQWKDIEKDMERVLQSQEKVLSIDETIQIVNHYVCEQILQPIGVEMKRAGDVYTYCGLTSTLVNRKTKSQPYRHDLKASCFLNDLYFLSKHIDEIAEDNKLLHYINSLNTSIEQYDLLQDTEQLRHWYTPRALPLGRWPSPFNLSLMQQVAVNIAKENPKEIFSVNGPPGTGKTTLLKDIIANNIVERASKICEYNHVEDIFTKVKSPDGDAYCYEIPSSISKYGMLVLSANNKAVENISLELPNISAVRTGSNDSHIFDPRHSDIKIDISVLQKKDDKDSVSPNEIYFTYLANQLHNTTDQWGLISTRLGNSKNISEFKPILNSLCTRLESVMNVKSAQDLFVTAKKQFQEQYELVTQLFAYTESYEQNIQCLKELEGDISKLEATQKALDCEINQYTDIEGDLTSIESRKLELLNDLIELNAKRSLVDKVLGKISISVLKGLSNTALLSIINEKNRELKSILAELVTLHDRLQLKYVLEKQRIELESECKTLQENIVDIKAVQGKLCQTLQLSNKDNITCFDTVESSYGVSRNKDESAYISAHTAYLYVCDYINECREQLFFDALQVQKAVAISKPFRKNMQLLSSYWGSYKKRQELDKQFGLDQVFPLVFNTLFLAVPVISSTFAAVESMLRNCTGEGSIGTIIVDEAGQASPHMVLGALYRAQQAIIVGDPKQIEPVQTVQDLFVNYVGNHDIDCYRHKELSVQRLADAQNPFAGTIREEDDSVSWVGCPLVVHRRCGEIMFNVSNELSYGGFMINETVKPKEPVKIALPSCWITYDASQIISKSKKDHYINTQGEIGAKLINLLQNHNVKLDDIFVISPFKTVAEGFKAYMSNQLVFIDDESRDIWIENNIGTVHTFQGKEAKVVIYMLGCQSDGTANGAIKWVNANNVNVAFTRAREYIYVIGDATKWAELNKNLAFTQRYLPIYTLEDF